MAAVHRSRLFAQHLPAFGWEPIILTVDEKFYEESLDYNLEKLLPENLRIEKVGAFRLTKPRIIGDIGLRGFLQLYKRAKEIILKENIDFLYILIPSYYTALLGRWLNTSTGIKYGIDYIDPWVHEFRGSNKTFSRHWISKKLAEILEPIAIKNSSLITGVAEGYYKGVQERNIALKARCVFGAMPYGGEKTDHERVNLTSKAPYLFDKKNNKIQLVYAGAMLPKAYAPLERILKVLKENSDFLTNLELHFIGTGRSANDVKGYNIRPLAEKYGVWNTKVFEYPQRIPYFDVLIHLSASDGIFILGSTEPHYTPSKLFQAVLSSKPILAVLHKDSTGVEVLRKSNSGVCLDFNGEEGLDFIEENFLKVLKNYLISIETFDAAKVDRGIFEQYSARKVTETLAQLLNQVV